MSFLILLTSEHRFIVTYVWDFSKIHPWPDNWEGRGVRLHTRQLPSLSDCDIAANTAASPFGNTHPIRSLRHELDLRRFEVSRERWVFRQSTIVTDPGLRDIFVGDFLGMEASIRWVASPGLGQDGFPANFSFLLFNVLCTWVLYYLMWGKRPPLYCTGGGVTDLGAHLV